MRRLALRCSSSSSCSSAPGSQAKSLGGTRPTHQTLYGGALRRMQRCPAVPSKMPGKRYCLRRSQSANLALNLAEALGHNNKPCLGDEMPGPSKRLCRFKEEERPTKRKKGERPYLSSEQLESTISEAVRPAKTPRKGFSCMQKMSKC